MRFIPSTEGPQVAGRKPTVHTPEPEYVSSRRDEIAELSAAAIAELELSGAELYAEHTGNVSFLPTVDRRQGERRTVTHDADGELWGPPAKLGALLGVAVELDALGLHRLAWRIRQAVGAAA